METFDVHICACVKAKCVLMYSHMNLGKNDVIWLMFRIMGARKLFIYIHYEHGI